MLFPLPGMSSCPLDICPWVTPAPGSTNLFPTTHSCLYYGTSRVEGLFVYLSLGPQWQTQNPSPPKTSSPEQTPNKYSRNKPYVLGIEMESRRTA